MWWHDEDLVGIPPSNDDLINGFTYCPSRAAYRHLPISPPKGPPQCPESLGPPGSLQISLWNWVDGRRGSIHIWSSQPPLALTWWVRPVAKKRHLRDYLYLFRLMWAEWIFHCEATSIDWAFPSIQTRFLFQARFSSDQSSTLHLCFHLFFASFSTNSVNLGSFVFFCAQELRQ